MTKLLESINIWFDTYLSKPLHPVKIINHMIFIYQDYTKDTFIANIYYNTITKQYAIKSFNNQLNYCVNDMLEAFDCIIQISERYQLDGHCHRLFLKLKHEIIIEGYQDYSFNVKDYNDDDQWLIDVIC